MILSSPQIGFDRFIHREWVIVALRVRSGTAEMKDLEELLDSTHSGIPAKKKTRTVLNRLWLEPNPELVNFADRGVKIFQDAPEASWAALSWGMAISAYPFFGKVAEIVGRLTSIQGDCTSSEVHRRMSELYGEREGTRRMTNMILQTQASWGAICRTKRGKQLARERKQAIENPKLIAWMVEALALNAKRSLSVNGIELNPIIYPFDLGKSVLYILSTVNELELGTQSTSSQSVGLRVWK
jgi:hypothetical protein